MPADEELRLLSAAASAATISLVAMHLVVKEKRKRAKQLWMRLRPFFQRQHEYYVTCFHQTLSLAAILFLANISQHV